MGASNMVALGGVSVLPMCSIWYPPPPLVPSVETFDRESRALLLAVSHADIEVSAAAKTIPKPSAKREVGDGRATGRANERVCSLRLQVRYFWMNRPSLDSISG